MAIYYSGMDPVTQGALGSCFANNFYPKHLRDSFKQHKIFYLLLAFAAGMAPDLDVLIRSQADPMLYFKFHRHFTHSLIFIPVGASLVASAFFLVSKIKNYALNFTSLYGVSILAYSSHALLDSCTSYGTLLAWPFSSHRYHWDVISIIDPIYTTLLIASILCFFINKHKLKLFFFTLSFAYIAFGFHMQKQAASFHTQQIAQRGHVPFAQVVKPSFANLLLWRVLYIYDGYIYSDAVRISLFSNNNKFFEGEKIKQYTVSRDFPSHLKKGQSYTDAKLFSWFSSHYIADLSDNQEYIDLYDMRYAILPHKLSGMWGLRFHKQKDNNQKPQRLNNRNVAKGNFKRFWEMLSDREY